MQDIERIEVIRGPGGTLWGANAVNGVINIITKRADELDGSSISFLAGTEEQLIGDVRVGGRIGEAGHLRAYMKTTDRDGLRAPASGFEGDESSERGGFRADWDLSDDEEFTLQGDVFRVDQGRSLVTVVPTAPFVVTVLDKRRMEGGNLLGHWMSTNADGQVTSLQSYYDHTELDTAILLEKRDTFDIDFQHQVPFAGGHSVMAGLGYRITSSETVESAGLSFVQRNRTDQLFSAFVQGEAQASEDLVLIAGTKIEHNEYTAFEVQPSVRFSLDQGEGSSVWGSISRAVRTPAQVSEDLRFLQGAIPNTPPGFTTLVELNGSENFDSEVLVAYELGYRTRPTENTSLDIATFYHDYENLQTLEFGVATPIGGGLINLPVFFDNKAEGYSYGTEVAAQLIVNESWTIHSSYSLLFLEIDQDASSASLPDRASSQAPKNQAHLRSFYSPTSNTEFDVAMWYVDALGSGVSSYIRSDVRLGWRPTEDSRLSFGVQGLFHDEEEEFAVDFFGPNYANQVGVYVQLELDL